MCISSNLDSFLFFTHFHCLPGWLAGWEISTCRSVFAIDPVNILGIDMEEALTVDMEKYQNFGLLPRRRLKPADAP